MNTPLNGTRYSTHANGNACSSDPPIDRILSRLEGVKAAGEGKWTARCPAHEDAHASLSIAVGADLRVLVNCHTGCTAGAIVAGVGLELHDLFSPRDDPPRSQASATTTGPPSIDWTARAAEYTNDLTPELAKELANALHLPEVVLDTLPIGWCDAEQCWTFPECGAAGNVIGLMRRYRDGNKKLMAGGQRGLTIPKDWQRRAAATGPDESGTNRFLPILLPEGASDTLTATALGHVAIGRPNNCGGSGALAELLRAVPAEQTIIAMAEWDPKPDGTWPGKDGAIKIAKQLTNTLGRPVQWALPPDRAKDVRRWTQLQALPIDGEALADAWETAGEEFAEAVLQQLQDVKPDDTTADALPILTAGEMFVKYPTLRPSVIEGLLRRGETMNIIAASKTGKSWLVLALVFAVVLGRRFLNLFDCTPGRVLLIDNELHGETILYRLRRMAEKLGVLWDDIADRIHAMPLRGRLQDLEKLGATLATIEPGTYALVVIDAFYRTLPIGTDENSNAAVAGLYNLIDQYADRMGSSFALIHHSSKGSQSEKAVTDVGSGAGSQSRAADTHLILRPHEEEDAFVLDGAVRSWAPINPICLRWKWPLWTPDVDLDPTKLRPARARKPKPEGDPSAQPKEPWTAQRFASEIGRPEPKTRAVMLDDARLAGLSDRSAANLLASAVDRGCLFMWRPNGNPSSPALYSTAKPTDLPPVAPKKKRKAKKAAKPIEPQATKEAQTTQQQEAP